VFSCGGFIAHSASKRICGRASAPDPAGRAYNTPSYPQLDVGRGGREENIRRIGKTREELEKGRNGEEKGEDKGREKRKREGEKEMGVKRKGVWFAYIESRYIRCRDCATHHSVSIGLRLAFPVIQLLRHAVSTVC